MRRFLILPLVVLSLSAHAQKKPASDLTKKVSEFDLYVQSALKQWDVPGAAVVVAKDGQVIHKKAYGVRELGKNNPVTTETLFACASTTKAMTAVCLGILVDEGKVKWDDPVTNYLPDFLLYDPFVTRELRVRDLLTHNSGVGNTDFLWAFMDIPEDEVLYRMRLVKPTYSLRSSFIYQNIFYLAAGKVVEKASGKPWEDFMRERIFAPLQMKRTSTKMKYVEKDPNLTTPHYKIDNVIKPITHTKDDAVGPAGSVVSSIDDMGKWVICMLDSSKYAGGRLLKAATWAEMFKPQTMVTDGEFYPTARITKPNWKTYGLGWFQHDYRGRKINFHTGSLSGLVALHAQLPDEKLGYYFFGNFDHAEVRHALMYRTFDHFALGGTRDWSTEFLTLYTGIREKYEKETKEVEAKRVMNTRPSLALQDYTGKYSDPLYGEIEITLDGNKLSVNINNFEKATLEHWNYDTFRGSYGKAWYGKASCTFSLDGSGKVAKLNFDGIELSKNSGQ